QVVTALDRVEGVPLGVILAHVAQGRPDATLRRARVGARRVELRAHGDRDVRVLGRIARGHEARAPGAHHHDAEPGQSVHLSLSPRTSTGCEWAAVTDRGS